MTLNRIENEAYALKSLNLLNLFILRSLDSFHNFPIQATKLYFLYYLRVVIDLFSTGLYQSVSSTYFFRKLVFPVSVFTLFAVCYVF